MPPPSRKSRKKESTPRIAVRMAVIAMVCMIVATMANRAGVADKSWLPAIAVTVVSLAALILFPLGLARAWSQTMRGAVGWLIAAIPAIAIMLAFLPLFVVFYFIGTFFAVMGLLANLFYFIFIRDLVEAVQIARLPKPPPAFARPITPNAPLPALDWHELAASPDPHVNSVPAVAPTPIPMPKSAAELLIDAVAQRIWRFLKLTHFVGVMALWFFFFGSPSLVFIIDGIEFARGQTDAMRDLEAGNPVEWQPLWRASGDFTGKRGYTFGLPWKPYVVQHGPVRFVAELTPKKFAHRRAPAYVRGYHRALRQWRAIHGSIPNAIPPTAAPQTARK